MACRMMGLGGGTLLPPGSYLGSELPPVVGKVKCRGSEGNLTSCQYSIKPACSSKDSVALECTSKQGNGCSAQDSIECVGIATGG